MSKPGEKPKNDSHEDINRLYNALAKNKMNEATMLLTHLLRFHKLTRKDVIASIRLLGAEKAVAVQREALEKHRPAGP